MGSRFQWKVQGVEPSSATNAASSMEQALNEMEDQGFEIYGVQSAPGGEQLGTVILGRKVRRFPG